MRMAILLLLLQGCATEQFDWRHEREPAKRPYAVVYIAPELVPTACGIPARACTVHSQRIIYLPEGAPAWYLEHERRHERGENHS